MTAQRNTTEPTAVPSGPNSVPTQQTLCTQFHIFKKATTPTTKRQSWSSAGKVAPHPPATMMVTSHTHGTPDDPR